jgi:hypothetical protein
VSQTKAELIKGLNINASAPATALQIDASGNVNIDSNTLYVDATNNRVGLGTSSPSTKLHVNSADSSATYLRVENTSGQAYFGVDGSGNTYAGAETNDAFGLVTNGSYRMYITSGGNVGIGTTSPSQRLHVANSADNVKLLVSSGFEAALELQNGGGSEVNVINSAGTGNLSFRVSNSEKMRMDSSGRLLVGTSSSFGGDYGAANLQVSGPLNGGPAELSLRRNYAGLDTSGMGAVAFYSPEGRIAQISANTDGTQTAGTASPGALIFSTTASGASSPTERMRIRADGIIFGFSGDAGIISCFEQWGWNYI